ncbi:hypothetical protein [Sphingomonas sp.]|uniref:hypothetical protein n=1 Tax=Sphingomonas sp. TaxID=28214 RepID=UPI003B003D5B
MIGENLLIVAGASLPTLGGPIGVGDRPAFDGNEIGSIAIEQPDKFLERDRPGRGSGGRAQKIIAETDRTRPDRHLAGFFTHPASSCLLQQIPAPRRRRGRSLMSFMNEKMFPD